MQAGINPAERRNETVKKDRLNVNASGIKDPTACEAISNVDKEDEKFHKLLYHIFYICELAGFRIDGRLTLISKKTGRVWR